MFSDMKNILLIVTSHDTLGSTGKPTGFWLEELAGPYRTFIEAGAKVDIASPKGGKPPVDPGSQKSDSPDVKWFLENKEAMNKLERTIVLSKAGKYDAYFVVGGHGVMWDLAFDEAAAKILGRAFDDGKVVAAVCHGPGALVPVKLANGDSIVKGRRVAGFSDEEEEVVKLEEVVPFRLESKLRELGGKYERGPIWKPFAVRDGRLVTGQNPASSTLVAKETLAAINAGA